MLRRTLLHAMYEKMSLITVNFTIITTTRMHQNNNALQKAEMVLEHDNVAHGELSTFE